MKPLTALLYFINQVICTRNQGLKQYGYVTECLIFTDEAPQYDARRLLWREASQVISEEYVPAPYLLWEAEDLSSLACPVVSPEQFPVVAEILHQLFQLIWAHDFGTQYMDIK